MKATELLKKVQKRIYWENEAKFLTLSNHYLPQINPSNPFYIFVRLITTQKQRDKLMKLSQSIFVSKDTGHYSVESDPLLKNFGIDYINYIYKKDPDMPDRYFYNKKDIKVMHNFVDMMIFAGYRDKIPFDIMGSENLSIWRNSSLERKNIKTVKGFFEYKGFRCRIPAFENLYNTNSMKLFKNRKYNVSFDLGAFVGDTSYLIHKAFEAKRIYAFEPERDNFKILKETIRINKLNKIVQPVQLATGLSNSSLSFKASGGASAFIKKNEKGSYKVSVRSLDSFVKEGNIEKVDFIKMDIEGAEFDTLKGAIKTLKRDKPDLIITVYHKGEHFFEIPVWLKKIVPEYNLRFVEVSSVSPVLERSIFASVKRI